MLRKYKGQLKDMGIQYELIVHPDDEEETIDLSILDFPDVAEDDWFAEPVAILVDLGIVQGRDDGLYYPDADVTRAEFLKMAMESKGIDSSLVSSDTTFTDISNHWAYQYIRYGEVAQFIDAGGTFNPD
jgi:hypothetical protein